jgi:hypothetical protein
MLPRVTLSRTFSLRGVAFLIGSVFFWLCALFFWTSPINCAVYLLGLGKKVTVTVQTGSRGWRFSRGDRAGTGYYERGGERVLVELYGAQAGETVSATLPLIPLRVGAAIPVVYVSRSQAALEFVMGMIGGLVLSGIALPLTLHYIGFLRGAPLI